MKKIINGKVYELVDEPLGCIACVFEKFGTGCASSGPSCLDGYLVWKIKTTEEEK